MLFITGQFARAVNKFYMKKENNLGTTCNVDERGKNEDHLFLSVSGHECYVLYNTVHTLHLLHLISHAERKQSHVLKSRNPKYDYQNICHRHMP
jgi:hypothetical protein